MQTFGSTKITPAEVGILAVAIDDAIANGASDDTIVDCATSALIGDGMDRVSAEDVAYHAWHSGWYLAQRGQDI